MAEIMTEYFYQRQKTAQAGGQDPESLRKSKAEELQRAIEKVQEDLRSKKDNPWAEAGHWLVAEQSLEAPEHLSACVDPKLGLSENIENCFRKAKELERKQKGSEERLLALQKELALIQNATPEELSVSISSAVRDLQPKPKNFKGRVLRLPSGRTFLMGRSGRENLEVLRQCSPWDYWLHLRDYPGAHGVLRRQKSERITDEELHQAAHILIRESFRTKIESKDGERFDVLLAELRYVRPIKGDRRGLVTYSNERVLQHQFRRL
jgi:predicted ribosome quality control (RQC) complex YloA/Tae2 family protein